MKNSILMALKDSATSRPVLDFFNRLSICHEDYHITLLHVLRKPSASEELMGKKFAEHERARVLSFLQKARDRLVEIGYSPDKIQIKLVTEPYPTIAEGIIDQFEKGSFDMVVIGRKSMSRAEEFVLGDVSAKLVRSLVGTAVLVVRSN